METTENNLQNTSSKPLFVVIGDVLMDNFVSIPDKAILARNHERESLELPFPTKVALESAPVAIPGGNAYTVSMVLAKLGFETHIYSEIGADNIGSEILNKLKEQNVYTDLVKIDAEASTNSSVIISAAGDRLIFSYHYPRKYQLPALPQADFVYLTSIGEDDEILFEQVIEAKKQSKFNLIFSPGSTQMKEEYSQIAPVMQATDLLILNKQEAQKITGNNTSEDAVLLKSLQDLGPDNVIITNSVAGSAAITSTGELVRIKALEVEVVETTGAGDTYSATASAAIALGHDFYTAMKWGAINSASVVQHVGCEAGILTTSEIEDRLNSVGFQLDI